MLLNSLDAIKTKKYDVVILGSGPAGVATVLSLPSSVNVLLVEAGSADYSVASQLLYQGTTVGDQYYDLDACRLRQFGGASGHWAGKCRTLDDFDYALKPYAPTANWPIQKKDLDPYTQAACSILEVSANFETKPYVWDQNVASLSFQYSPPVRFKHKYFKAISKSKNIDLILDTALIAAELKNDSIQALVLSTDGKEKVSLSAQKYVFAMGGIENGRMLKFMSVENPRSALGKNPNVGAYWMEHPHNIVGDFFYQHPKDETWHIGISAEQKQKLGVLNCNLNFRTYNRYTDANNEKKLLQDLICANEVIGAEISYQLGKNYCGGQIHAASEQEPRFENRIDLDSEVDALGIPKVVLRWEKSDFDLKTTRATVEYVAESMVKNDFAKIRLREWLWTGDYSATDLLGGSHHMGGTKMSSSRHDGVVDANLKCWDVSNLYIAGSSIFPSSGHANPTFTIVQLAVRLAAHLMKESS